MLSNLFVLAEAAVHATETAAAAGEASGITKILNDFGIRVPDLIAQIVNFSIVAFILWRFAFKPVMASIQERQEKIQAGLKYAEDMKAQLAAAQQESAALVKQAQLEANRIIEESRRTAKELSDKAQKDASDNANAIIAKAQQAIELEHKKMLADARGEIARLVVVTTERVLAKRLSDSDRATFNEAAAKELTSV
ncbi:ATP synthase F0 subunit B [Opitutaceae bacterium EW11]|nr:ATP synthase F0 subunit B [Opitutaceae bacterium EW11]